MDVDDADGPLDPRIQIELENLNNSTDEINKLEIELDEAHTAFRQLLSDSTRRLKEIANKLGTGCIEKARCYYEALEVAQQARVQCQRQAQLFQRASEIHAAAKETVALAEARFMSHQHEWNFDQAWQDMLNHATIKVMDAENQKAECGREHHRRAMLFHDAEKKVQQLEEKHRRAIIKSRPYFEIRAQCDQMLAIQKERVETLQKGVKNAKRAYASSLQALEDISNQIHQRRRDYDIVANGPREPGVGAELISPPESLNYEAQLNKINVSRINSLASSEPDPEDRSRDFEDICDLKQRMEQLNGRSADGSESTTSQWELELQASMEKLNAMPNGEFNVEADHEKRNVGCESSRDFENGNERTVGNEREILKTSRNDSFRTEKFSENDRSEHRKFPGDFQIFKKPFAKMDPPSLSEGWQSLTQSPLHSIVNRSKIALRNSISKSLSNSPVNSKPFGFAMVNKSVKDDDKRQGVVHRTKNQTSSSDNREVANNHQKLERSSGSRKKISVDKSNVEIAEFVGTASSVTSGRDLKFESEDVGNRPDRCRDDAPLRSSCEETRVREESDANGTNFTSRSVDSTPAKTKSSSIRKAVKSLVDRPIDDFVECPELKTNSKTSSVKELPLLSIFDASAEPMSKDKSHSMINLAEKRNLKTLLDTSNLGNIQAVSVEKLANARYSLIGDDSKRKHEYFK